MQTVKQKLKCTLKLKLRLVSVGLMYKCGASRFGFSVCPSLKKKNLLTFFLLFLHIVSSTALSAGVELLYMCDTFLY